MKKKPSPNEILKQKLSEYADRIARLQSENRELKQQMPDVQPLNRTICRLSNELENKKQAIEVYEQVVRRQDKLIKDLDGDILKQQNFLYAQRIVINASRELLTIMRTMKRESLITYELSGTAWVKLRDFELSMLAGAQLDKCIAVLEVDTAVPLKENGK